VRHCRTQPSRRPYFYHSSRPTFFFLSRRCTTALYISRKPHISSSFSHAQIIQYPSFPLTPTIFIHSNPNLKSAIPSGRNPSPFLDIFRRLFVARLHRSCSRSPCHAPLLPQSWWFVGLYYILRPSLSPLPLSLGVPRPAFPVETFTSTSFLSNGRHLSLHRLFR